MRTRICTAIDHKPHTGHHACVSLARHMQLLVTRQWSCMALVEQMPAGEQVSPCS